MARNSERMREVFNEREASAMVRTTANTDERKAWLRIIDEAHCHHCSVLILVPWSKHDERYLFSERAFAHEISCPLDR